MFKDRYEAGRKLGQTLSKKRYKAQPIVLAIPRGGVVVGYQVAKELGCPECGGPPLCHLATLC
ncbi:putative phosphoribosyl transferase [Candidatus Hakubella thermalkaliphila]|uniref:Putative phosphoribosyl transferase n=1 Tax=Candidatus Hakubella thermalkaliphila TaxID=2754717 RepID=A0A6V8NUS6_9ACTN|nr:putative phosphoribosyl transferase [Candidatus Hakubella thermalkaliphila]